MASLDLIQRHLFATVVLSGLLLGGIAGLFFPIRAVSPVKSGSEAWHVPTLADTNRFSEKAFLELRGARFWKSVAGPGRRGAVATEWKLAAIITGPRPLAAVSSSRGKSPSALVPVGGELPDGSTLLRMTRDAVWFEKDGCVRERRLYREVTADNNACLVEATSDQPGPPPPKQARSRPGGPSTGSGSSAPPASPAAGGALP